MRDLLRTTGLLSLTVWAVFLILGIVQKRPAIAIISGVFFAITVYRRWRIRNSKAPDEAIWEAFSSEHPEMKDYPYKRWRFDETNINENVIQKIVDRKISGEAYSVDFFEANNEPLPEIGSYNVAIYGLYTPCIVKTVDLIFTTWGSVTDDLARIEGYPTASKWRLAKKIKFQNICDAMEYEFTDDLELVFEKFEVVYDERDFEDYLRKNGKLPKKKENKLMKKLYEKAENQK